MLRSGLWAVGALVLSVTGVTVPVAGAAPPVVRAPLGTAAGAPVTSNSGFIPVAPVRVLETRPGSGGTGSFGAFETRSIDVTTVLGVAPSAVAAVALNVTVTESRAPGYLTVWPGGVMPVASTINFTAGQTVPNGIVVGVDGAGRVSIFDGSPGAVDVLVDVTGWLPSTAGFTPVPPVRVLETRAGSPGYAGGAAFTHDETRSVDVVARAGLPAGQVGAVALNLTVTAPTGAGYLQAYPSGGTVPATSSLNFGAGDVVANSQVLGVSTDGRIDVRAFLVGAGAHVDVVIDVTGWFSPDHAFHPLVPQRLIDTRQAGGPTVAEPVEAGQTYLTKLDELASLPRGMVGAVALNVTVTEPSSAGFLTLWPTADTTIGAPEHGRPSTSFVNFGSGQTVANTVIVGVGAGLLDLSGDAQSDVSGAIGLYVNAGTADVVIDITGWFPQDTLGLVADGVEARRYSLGADRIAVIGCTAAGEPYTTGEVNAVTERLAVVAAYYQAESAGRYVPQYTWVGAVAPIAAADDTDCIEPAVASHLADGYDTQLVVRREPSAGATGVIAYGFAGPGFPCEDSACGRHPYPANGRDGVVTLNTLIDTGTVANGVASPFWMLATHEFGHTLDWPHSYTGTGTGCWGGQYDNPVDVMSRPPLGSPPSCMPNQGAFPTAPQRTIALNRYSAGWLDHALVQIHRVSGATYTVGAQGRGATELLVVPSADSAAYTTIEARVGGEAGDPDSTLQASGIVVHRVDQRADPFCFTVRQLGLDRCSGLDRRVQPLGAQADAYGHVLGPAATVDLGGVTMTVTAAGAGTFGVRLDGTTASFDHIPACGVYTACAGSAIRAATPLVCLVGASAGAVGRDRPSAFHVTSTTSDVVLLT